jgi:hypothetical protein
MKEPYSKRTDLEKLESNWTKTMGPFNRGEFSVSIVRAATAVELAANFVIRNELCTKHTLPKEFVDDLLVWANGLNGKFTKLIIPITKGSSRGNAYKQGWEKLKKLNRERNSVAHSGEFKGQTTAVAVLNDAREVIQTLVRPYRPGLKLEKIAIKNRL